MSSSSLVRMLVATALLAAVAAATAEAPTPGARIDHVILGAADLDRATDAFEGLTGVRPVYGGKHPSGTHNALVSLGEHAYLEIIAVQPGATPPPRFSKLGASSGLEPIGWAVAADNEAVLRQALTRAAFSLTSSTSGSRITPTGDTLAWTTFDLSQDLADAPFFITWAPETPHPSTTSPEGCTLMRLLIAGPHAEELGRLAKALDLTIELGKGASAEMTLELDCPKGPVRFEPVAQQSPPDA